MRLAALLVVGALCVAAQEHVTLQARDGARVPADVYGSGDRGVVLAHGGRFNKESWAVQAKLLAGAGFRVVAVDLRRTGQSLHLDVLAAVDYLRKAGVKDVSLVGGSMGGDASADAAEEAGPSVIGRVVLLGSTAGSHPEKLRGRKLILMAREDANASGLRLPSYQVEWAKVPEPKRIVLVDGSAHAQFLFQSDQAERVTGEILRFLSAR